MRFKKGSKIEVFSNDEVPYGAWRCAEIISGNGHTYTVKYNFCQGTKNEAIVERVSRKKIRPCPPPVDVERWEAGELVEVCDGKSWKMATVLKDIGGNYYSVRLLGVPKELSVLNINIRVRQSWQDDRWFVIGKVSGSEFTKSTRMSGLESYQKPQVDANFEVLTRGYCSAMQNITGYQESNIMSTRLLKRASALCSSSYAESCTGNPRKTRLIEKEGQQQRYPSSSLQKVDAVAYPQKYLGKKYMHGSFNTNGYHEMVRVKSNCFTECVRAGSPEANDSDSDACSVGSCSVISYDENKVPSRILAGSCQDADSLSSDAESFCGRGDEEKCNYHLGEDEAVSNHRFELDSYRSTLEALFASGPLSWEQETSLTDLRLSLNISDDEHLTELRNLISARTSKYIS